MSKGAGFWNFRIVFHRGKGRNPEHYVALHEAHYDESQRALPVNEAMPRLISSEPTTVHAEDLDGMQWAVKMIEAALEKPILEYVDGKIVLYDGTVDPVRALARKRGAR